MWRFLCVCNIKCSDMKVSELKWTEVYIMSDGSDWTGRPVPSLPPGWSVTCEDLIYVSGVTWGMVSFMKFQSHLDMSSKPWLAKLGQWARLYRDFVITSPAQWFVGFSLCQWICAQQRFHLINWFERAVFVPLLFRRLTSLSAFFSSGRRVARLYSEVFIN